MIVKIDDEAINAITSILHRGNDAVVKKKGCSVIVLEEVKKIRYNTGPIGDQERAIGAES